METLIDTLYVYAQENRVTRHLRTPGYSQAVTGIEEDWKAFKATLTVEQGERLNALLLREIKTDYLEDKASFLAGLSIGLDLGRL